MDPYDVEHLILTLCQNGWFLSNNSDPDTLKRIFSILSEQEHSILYLNAFFTAISNQNSNAEYIYLAIAMEMAMKKIILNHIILKLTRSFNSNIFLGGIIDGGLCFRGHYKPVSLYQEITFAKNKIFELALSIKRHEFKAPPKDDIKHLLCILSPCDLLDIMMVVKFY